MPSRSSLVFAGALLGVIALLVLLLVVQQVSASPPSPNAVCPQAILGPDGQVLRLATVPPSLAPHRPVTHPLGVLHISASSRESPRWMQEVMKSFRKHKVNMEAWNIILGRKTNSMTVAVLDVAAANVALEPFRMLSVESMLGFITHVPAQAGGLLGHMAAIHKILPRMRTRGSMTSERGETIVFVEANEETTRRFPQMMQQLKAGLAK